MEDIGTIILATGALGVAAFGIVEGLKWTKLGEAGFGTILKILGPITQTLQVAYGPDFARLLRAQYRGDMRELTRALRQGVRIGLNEQNARELAEFVGTVDVKKLTQAARKAARGKELSAELRNTLGRFELAADARIDASLTLAHVRYVGVVRGVASFVALSIALAVGYYQGAVLRALLVGLAAVPLAPVAKDLVTALQSASKAIRTKS